MAISLFSGAGGMDLGVEAAGYRVAAAVEIDHDAADTMEKNFDGLASPVIRQSILEVPTKEIVRAAGLRGRERPDLLIGGPPCTPFSKSGFWLEWKRAGLDPDASLLQAYTRVLAEARPRAFILENVYALTYNNKASKPAFERLLREIDEAGYHCRWSVLNAADYGVPQLRPRLFVIGVPKRTRLPELPEPTHGGHVGRARDRHGRAAARDDWRGAPWPQADRRNARRRCGVGGDTCSPRSRPARTTSTTQQSAGTRSRSSSGGAATGRSC